MISRITLREIRLPLVEPFRTASGVVTERRVLLLELADGDGAETWSECVAESSPGYGAETVDTCWAVIEDCLAPRIVGKAFQEPSGIRAMLDREVHDHRMAKAAVEMGGWGLEALRRQLPLASGLVAASEFCRDNGFRPRYHVETGIALGMQPDPATLARRAGHAVAAGYRRIKIKIEPGRDIDFVRAARVALGPAVDLSADANRSYAGNDSKLTMLRALDEFGLSMIEQPLGLDDMAQHAELQRSISTPVCLDESITGVTSTRVMIELGSAKIVNLKPGRVGGFSEAIAIHDICARASVPVWCGGMLETGIGRAYNVALASLPNFALPGDLSPSDRYWARDIVTPAWTMSSEGRVRVPLDRAGIGIDVDAGWIDQLTTRTTTIEAR